MAGAGEAQKSRFKGPRERELAFIHIAKAKLGLNDDIYRDLLEAVGGKRSAADLSPRGRALVLRRFGELGIHFNKPRRKFHKGPKASADRAPMIGKIDAMLYEAGHDRTYAEGILKRMFGEAAPARLEWAAPEQLHKVVAALVYDAKRHGRRDR